MESLLAPRQKGDEFSKVFQENSLKYVQSYRSKGWVLRDPGHRGARVPEIKHWQEILGAISPKALDPIFVLGLMTTGLIFWPGVQFQGQT